MAGLFFHNKNGMSSFPLTHIFQRGRSTTNQIIIVYVSESIVALLPNNRWLDISSRGLWTTFNTHQPGGSLGLQRVEQRGPAQPVSMRLQRLLRWPHSIHKLWYSLDIYIYHYISIVLFVCVTLSILVDLTFFVWLICILFTLSMFLSLSLHTHIYINTHVYTHHTHICATGQRMDAIHHFFWGLINFIYH